jgi:hypothetical protein
MAATKSTSKNSADKPATARKPRTAATKATSTRKPAINVNQQMSAEERYRMVEVAAYFLAERNRFSGNPVEYWTQAEAQIASLLGR